MTAWKNLLKRNDRIRLITSDAEPSVTTNRSIRFSRETNDVDRFRRSFFVSFSFTEHKNKIRLDENVEQFHR